MAQVQTSTEKNLNRLAIVSVLIVTMVFLAPISWIGRFLASRAISISVLGDIQGLLCGLRHGRSHWRWF